LAVEQVERLHFAINSKPSEPLDLTIPPSLLLRADQVIEIGEEDLRSVPN
jgi:hypothetical protein